MSCHRAYPVIAFAFSILLAAGAARADLIVNGGFETGDFTGWGSDPAPSGSFFGVASGGGHTGTWSTFFATMDLFDAIYQTVPTVAGQQYTLTFWLFSVFQSNNSFRVSWEGTTVLELAPVEVTGTSWKQYTLLLTATTSGSELRFAVSSPTIIHLDDVSLVEAATVPSPASAALGVIGAGFVILRRRR